jgi:hypothetical protein
MTLSNELKLLLGIPMPLWADYPDVPLELEPTLQSKLDSANALITKLYELAADADVAALDTIRLDSIRGLRVIRSQGRVLIKQISNLTGYPIMVNPFTDNVSISTYKPQ